MNKALGFIIFGVAGYLIYEWWKSQQSPLAAVASGTAIPVTLPTTPSAQPMSAPATPPVAIIPTATLRANLITAANSGYNATVQGGTASGMSPDSIMLSISEWAYWYHQLTGQFDENTSTGGSESSQIASFLGVDYLKVPITVDQFISGLKQVGLAGLRGLGYLADDNPVRGMSIAPRSVNTGIGNQHLPYEMAYAGHGIGLEGFEGAGRGVPMGLGRSYNSGFGMLGQGYGINETLDGDASRYEMASKWVM